MIYIKINSIFSNQTFKYSGQLIIMSKMLNNSKILDFLIRLFIIKSKKKKNNTYFHLKQKISRL